MTQLQRSLSDVEIRMFHENGFLKFRNVLPPDRVKALREAILYNVENEIEPVQRGKDGSVGRISDIVDREPVFWETVTSPLILDPLESLLGPNIELLTNRHNHATLRRSVDGPRGEERQVTGWHRDVKEWSRTIVTILLYLEETHLENGCTRVVPGSHLIPRHALDRQDGKGIAPSEELLHQALPVPMPAGGILAINSMVLHAVGPNLTDGSRMSMTVGYHSVDELATVDEPARRLVRGQRIYQGNTGERAS